MDGVTKALEDGDGTGVESLAWELISSRAWSREGDQESKKDESQDLDNASKKSEQEGKKGG